MGHTSVTEIHLEQLSTTGNYVDGAPSIRNGYISELKITIRDNSGKLINNHGQPLFVVLEFQPTLPIKSVSPQPHFEGTGGLYYFR